MSQNIKTVCIHISLLFLKIPVCTPQGITTHITRQKRGCSKQRRDTQKLQKINVIRLTKFVTKHTYIHTCIYEKSPNLYLCITTKLNIFYGVTCRLVNITNKILCLYAIILCIHLEARKDMVVDVEIVSSYSITFGY